LDEAALLAFIKRALDDGRKKFAYSSETNRVSVNLGDANFDFTESEYSLTAHVHHCLVSGTVRQQLESDIKIFADYSGWYLHDAFMLQHRDLSDLEHQINVRLEKIGIRANYKPRLQAWDIFDTNTRFGLRLLRQKDAIEPWEPTSPLAFFCKWIADLDHKTIIHAGSLSKHGKGALMVGNGGAGKSGTVIGAMKHGFQSSGDDYTLLSKKANGYCAHAVFRTVKQDLAGLKRLNIPRPADLNWQNKAVFRPENVFQNGIVDSVAVHVLLFPSIGGVETTFHAVDPVIVFKTLTMSTLKQLTGSYAPIFVTCAKLIHDLPCFGIKLSSNPEEVSSKLALFMENLKC
jgi:hypothetical protein